MLVSKFIGRDLSAMQMLLRKIHHDLEQRVGIEKASSFFDKPVHVALTDYADVVEIDSLSLIFQKEGNGSRYHSYLVQSYDFQKDILVEHKFPRFKSAVTFFIDLYIQYYINT